jgi:preprotein translocase subunit SecD
MLRFSSWKTVVVLGICLLGLIYTLPNLFPREQMERMPRWLPHQQINLGLDLQGGSHLLLEVDLSALVKERLDGLVDEVRSTLRPERIGYRDLGVRGNAVTFTLTDPADAPRALEALRKLDQSVGLTRELAIQEAGAGRIEIRLTDQAAEEMQRAAVTQSLEIVRRRIDEVGTREPNIQRQGSDRILVQVPGERTRRASNACSARPPS